MSGTLLVIPHFCDTLRFGPFLEELMAVLPSHFAVLVSDDGSGQAEVTRLGSLISRKRAALGPNAPTLLDPLLHEGNTGKGGAVVRGWEMGNGYSLVAFVMRMVPSRLMKSCEPSITFALKAPAMRS